MSRALFIGRSVVDVLALVEDFPGADGKTKAISNDLLSGGSALNAAATFAHLGGKATLATSLGSPGLMREFVVNDMSNLGFDHCDFCDDPAYSMPISTVVSTRSMGTRMIVNGAQDECQQLKDSSDLFNNSFDLIQLDQYEHPFIDQHQAYIRAFKGPVILDGGSWKDCSPDFLKLADIPVVSEVFCTDGPQGFSDMCIDMGFSRWAITRGARGVLWRDGTRSGEIPAVKVSVVDTLGAGDVFHGAFCHAFAESGAFVDALEFANRIAAKSCENAGTRSWMND